MITGFCVGTSLKGCRPRHETRTSALIGPENNATTETAKLPKKE